MRNLRSTLLRIATFGLVAISFAGCTVGAKKNRALQRAAQYFRNAEFEKAKIEYLNVLKLDPKDARANERLGTLWYDQGAPLRAGPYLLAARAALPGDLNIRVKLAQIAFTAGNVDAARREALAILERSPGQEDALLLLTSTIRNAEEYSRTEEEIRRASEQRGAGVQLALASLNLHRGDAAGAKAALQRALRADPKSPLVHSALAAYYDGQNNVVEARKAFQAAADLSPLRSTARVKLAEFKARRGAPDEAAAELRSITAKSPEYLPAWTALAHLALQQKKNDETAALLKNVFSRDSENYEAHVLHGQMLLARGDATGAVEYLKRVATAYPKLAPDKYFLARAHLQNQQPAETIAALDTAISLQPDYADAILLRAEINLKGGRPEPVLTAMVGLLTRRPDLVQGQVMLAETLRALDRFDEAAKVIREQIRVSPQSGQPHFLLGIILLEQKKTDEARASFERSIELAPGHLPSVSRLVELDLQERKFASALARVQALAAESADAHYLEAKIQAAQGRWTDANTRLRKAIELDVNHSPSYSLLLYGLISNRELTQAIREVEGLRAKSPENPTVLVLAGSLYTQLNEAEKAREAYEKLLAVRPDSSLALNNLAVAYSELPGQLDRAHDMAGKAREIDPASGPIADTLGWIQFKRGDYAAALESLREAVTLMPDNPEVQYHFAMANERTGQLEPARIAFQKAADAKADFPGKDEARKRLALLKGAGVITSPAAAPPVPR